jgi:acetylglutamate kinase
VPGVFVDGELIETIAAERAESMIEKGLFEGGIVPKLLAAAHAAKHGVAADIGVTAVAA